MSLGAGGGPREAEAAERWRRSTIGLGNSSPSTARPVSWAGEGEEPKIAVDGLETNKLKGTTVGSSWLPGMPVGGRLRTGRALVLYKHDQECAFAGELPRVEK